MHFMRKGGVSLTAATPSANKICSLQPLILWNSYADYFIPNFRLYEGVSMVQQHIDIFYGLNWLND